MADQRSTVIDLQGFLPKIDFRAKTGSITGISSSNVAPVIAVSASRSRATGRGGEEMAMQTVRAIPAVQITKVG
jgi:hypothetical protein